jgi:hypothetical protein
MTQPKRPRLVGLMWWSVRLSWSRSKATRRRCREEIWKGLEKHWRGCVPDAPAGSETAIVRAVWLGAALASRSLARYPLLSRGAISRLRWITRIMGRTTGKAVVAAYLSWMWLKDAAHGFPAETPFHRTSS